MGVFTKILDKEREFIEEQYQIKILDIKNISNGILNSNFQIDCEDIKYILRIFEADRTLNEEEQELILLNKIASFIPVSEAIFLFLKIKSLHSLTMWMGKLLKK